MKFIFFRILDVSRNQIGEDIKRTDFLCKQDIYIVKRDYNVNIKDGVRHKEDYLSIDFWVNDQ